MNIIACLLFLEIIKNHKIIFVEEAVWLTKTADFIMEYCQLSRRENSVNVLSEQMSEWSTHCTHDCTETSL